MVDSTVPLIERLSIYNRAPVDLRLRVYDRVYSNVQEQFEASELRNALRIDDVLPPPPGLEEYRRMRALRAPQQPQDREDERSEVERR